MYFFSKFNVILNYLGYILQIGVYSMIILHSDRLLCILQNVGIRLLITYLLLSDYFIYVNAFNEYVQHIVRKCNKELS